MSSLYVCNQCTSESFDFVAARLLHPFLRTIVVLQRIAVEQMKEQRKKKRKNKRGGGEIMHEKVKVSECCYFQLE